MTTPDMEARFHWVPVVLVLLFGAAFALGLVLHVQRPGSREASVVLHTGLVLLMASPAARLLVALADRIRTRDHSFLILTLIVVLELAIVMWRASQKP